MTTWVISQSFLAKFLAENSHLTCPLIPLTHISQTRYVPSMRDYISKPLAESRRLGEKRCLEKAAKYVVKHNFSIYYCGDNKDASIVP